MSTEGSCQGISSGAASSGSTAKQRRKRKWDQPDESLLSVGLAVPGVLPVSNIRSLAGALVPGPMCASGASLANPLAASNANISSVIQAPVTQHQAAIILQKSSQTKIQDELLIAREIVINDAEPAVRFKLTKRQMQEEIQKCTGAVVITRGKYRPPNAVPDGEKPLYLHISAGAHLKETAERIIAVDRAAAMVEEMLKQVSLPVSTCVYLGFEADPSLNIATCIRGPNDQYINHIMNETGATVILRGRGSGNSSCTLGEEGLQPLHLFLSSNDLKSLESARLLAENLLDTISRDCGATRVPTSKVYGAVPQPQKLLLGVQISGVERKLDLSSVISYPSSVMAGTPASAFPVKTPVVTTDICCGLVAQPVGLFHSGQSLPNGMSYPQSSLISSTSYGGYAGIYPQATPLQQVALALRQSSPVAPAISPVTTTMGAELMPGDSTSCEKEKRPSQKRKFQELPAPSKANTASYQVSSFRVLLGLHVGSEIQKSTKSSSDARKFPNMPPPKELVDSPPKVIPQTLLCSMPSSNPPHRTLSPPPLSRGVLPPPQKKASTMPPPPPPPPKFNSLACAVEDSERESIACSSKPGTVPDTLVKLMEYGEDDDDDSEETVEDSCRSDLVAASKPFWAV